MSAVDPLYAQWLQRDGDYVVRSDAPTGARWGSTAVSTERLSPIATLAQATVQADRELAFFARGPFGVDEHQIVGTDWDTAIGTVVTLTGTDLGYDAGIDVFVTGVEIDRATGISTVTVLCPLRPL